MPRDVQDAVGQVGAEDRPVDVARDQEDVLQLGAIGLPGGPLPAVQEGHLLQGPGHQAGTGAVADDVNPLGSRLGLQHADEFPKIAGHPHGGVNITHIGRRLGGRRPGIGDEEPFIAHEVPHLGRHQDGVVEGHLVAMDIDVDVLLAGALQSAIDLGGEPAGRFVR